MQKWSRRELEEHNAKLRRTQKFRLKTLVRFEDNRDSWINSLHVCPSTLELHGRLTCCFCRNPRVATSFPKVLTWISSTYLVTTANHNDINNIFWYRPWHKGSSEVEDTAWQSSSEILPRDLVSLHWLLLTLLGAVVCTMMRFLLIQSLGT